MTFLEKGTFLMQAIRRSDRIRNRNRNSNRRFFENERAFEAAASLPNLHMGGDGNNISVDEMRTFEAEINPDIGDFIPNDQENVILFEEFPRRRFNYKVFVLGILKMLILLSLIITILFSAELLAPNGYIAKQQFISTFLSKNNNLNMGSIGSYYSLKCASDKLIKINKQIRHLNRRLKLLARALEEGDQWRDGINKELKTIKNDTLQITSNQDKQLNLKIEEALNLYDADKVGITDYALESAGGYIISTPDTIPYPSHFSYDIMGLVNIQYPSNPRLLIQPETLPGKCFAFKGSQGRIRIGLAHIVDITSVTLEHAYPNLVEDINSAPKDFKIYGLYCSTCEDKYELGSFIYRIGKKTLQTFPIVKTDKSERVFKHIELQIITNHGNPKYTCVYRFRVHGKKLM